MGLALVPDASPADWLRLDPAPWEQVVLFGPSTAEAYARLRLIPDPAHPEQSPTEHGTGEDEADLTRLRVLVDRLAGATGTPEEAYFCLWEGWGVAPSPTDGALRDSPLTATSPRPGVHLPNRSYYLFEGPLREIHAWPLGNLLPAFVWPRDRAWCLACDVDPHWVGVGATEQVVADLVGSSDLDVVRADPAAPQPRYLR